MNLVSLCLTELGNDFLIKVEIDMSMFRPEPHLTLSHHRAFVVNAPDLQPRALILRSCRRGRHQPITEQQIIDLRKNLPGAVIRCPMTSFNRLSQLL